MRNIPIQVCFMKLEIVISAKNIYKECISGLQFPWQFVNIININYKIDPYHLHVKSHANFQYIVVFIMYNTFICF